MHILFLTVFLSLILAGLFMVLFLYDRKRDHVSCAEQEALMPLDDRERPVCSGNGRKDSA